MCTYIRTVVVSRWPWTWASCLSFLSPSLGGLGSTSFSCLLFLCPHSFASCHFFLYVHCFFYHSFIVLSFFLLFYFFHLFFLSLFCFLTIFLYNYLLLLLFLLTVLLLLIYFNYITNILDLVLLLEYRMLFFSTIGGL